MAIRSFSVVAPLVFVALLTMVSRRRFGFGFFGYPFYGHSATVSMGSATEDFIEDSITRKDSDMGSAGIMGSVAVTETRRG